MYVRVHCSTTRFVHSPNLATAWNHRPPWRFCIASTVEKTIRKPFENSGAGYKALNKQHPRHGSKCTSLYICYLRVCSANTLLIRTTDILAQKWTSLPIFGLQVCIANLLLYGTSDIRVASEIRRGLFFVKRQRRCPPLTNALTNRRGRCEARA